MTGKMLRAFMLVCLLFVVVILMTLWLKPSKLRQLQTPPMTFLRSAAPRSPNVTRKSFVLLVYTEFFGLKEWIYINNIDGDCPGKRKNNCTKEMFDLTYDKRRYPESELVVFHARDMPSLRHLKSLFKYKPSWQFWIYYLLESPNVTPNTVPLNGMFDLTMTYRADSDFFAPYGNYEEIPFVNTAQQDFSLGKTKLVSWMVSNCGAGRRNTFVHKLQKYIPVDVYGSCSGEFGQSRSCNNEGDACKNIIKQYKFYLSFENALCEDYITEKYWSHLGDENIVPVVLGGADYTKLAIPDSYINVMDFKTVKDFADYLLYLDNNNTAYNQYFKWRQKYLLTSSYGSPICPICEKLTLETELKRTNRYQDLTDYWVKQGKCNEKEDLVSKMWRSCSPDYFIDYATLILITLFALHSQEINFHYLLTAHPAAKKTHTSYIKEKLYHQTA